MSAGWQSGPYGQSGAPTPLPPSVPWWPPAGPTTADGVPLASWGQRFWAYVLDLVPLWVVGGTLMSGWNRIYANELVALWVQSGIGSAPMPGPAELWARGIVQLWLLNGIFHVLFTGTWDLLWWWLAGGTPGQKMLGLRVVPVDQGRWQGRVPVLVLARRALLRRVLDGFIHPLFWISSLGAAQGRQQDWPDRFASTHVVVRRG